MSKRCDTPLSLTNIFALANAGKSERWKAKHFVNHHSFLMLFEKGFSFDREWGEFFVDGRLLNLTLNILGVEHTYVTGGVYLRASLRNKPPEACFFALPNEAAARALARLGYGNSIVLPMIRDENILEVARSIIEAAEGRLVIIGIGSPNQDILAQRLVMLGGQLEVLCVGAAVEFLAGTQKPPPAAMRKAGLEWLWRLATNFRVTKARVTTSVAGFMALIFCAKVKR